MKLSIRFAVVGVMTVVAVVSDFSQVSGRLRRVPPQRRFRCTFRCTCDDDPCAYVDLSALARPKDQKD